MDQKIPGTAADPGFGAGMAGGGPGGPLADAAAPVAAAQSVPAFGGLRGGKARADGLVPGSKAALAADREKERVRKANQRARLRADPSPLPGVAPGQDTAGPMGGGAVPGGPAPAGPAMPWQAEALKPVFDQLLPTLEQLTMNQLAGRAEKARLPAELVREIERDARWSEPAKKALEIGCPQLAAKYLNKTGVGAEYQPEIVVGTALAAIVSTHTLLLRKLDQLIAAQQPKEQPAVAANIDS